jgi:hypothetical protein
MVAPHTWPAAILTRLNLTGQDANCNIVRDDRAGSTAREVTSPRQFRFPPERWARCGQIRPASGRLGVQQGGAALLRDREAVSLKTLTTS